MKSILSVLVLIACSVLLAEGFALKFDDPGYRKTTSYIEKGDYLESPQHGSSGLHKHSDKAPHHDDSHSHEDSAEHKRHIREVGDDVETRRGSHSHSKRPGSGLGSGSHHGSSGFGSGSHHGSSGLGSGSHHGSGLGSGSHHSSGLHGSSGLGSGSHHGSGLGSGSQHGSSGFGSGSHHGSSGLGSGSHHSSGLHGSGTSHRPSSGLGSGSFYQGSSGSGHNRRPSSVRGGTLTFNDSSLDTGSEGAPPRNQITLKNDEYTCLYSNADKNIQNRHLVCNGKSCTLVEEGSRHTSWNCGTFKCSLRNFNESEVLASDKLFECSEERALITAPARCPPGHRPDRKGKCRPEA